MGTPSGPALVLVVGAGRSGTSSVTGALQALGLRVPQPEVEAAATNPRGFFEPQWVVVSGSRQTYYRRSESPEARRAGNIARVAGWVNLNLASEQHHREHPRVLVRYGDLLDDWRPVQRHAHERLDLRCATGLDWAEPHAVDDFIDPGLHRHDGSWTDIEVPAPLRDIAEEVWRQLGALADGDGNDDRARKALDELRADYDLMFTDAQALSRKPTAARRQALRRRVRRAG